MRGLTVALVFALAYGVFVTLEYSAYRSAVAVAVDELEGEVDMLQDTVIDLTD